MKMKTIPFAAPDFSGSVPQHYERYLGPMFIEPYAIEISRRIDPSFIQLALEIASGTGRVTRHLRGIIPATSRLIASDISPDMLTVAKEKLKGLAIDWRIIDAQQLPFDDNSVDLVVCCFGYMFVPDKPKAFSEVFRVLKPGGMLIFSTWDKLELNAASNIYRKVVIKYLEGIIPDLFNLPFSMNDHSAIKKVLQQAGFSKITIESVDKVSSSSTAKEAAYGLARGGTIYNEITKHHPVWVEEITATVEKELGEKFGTAPMNAPMKAVVCQAWK
jgi:ubiquinone/menaquinone biosynthesis C-methylase UbiE